MPRGRPPKSDDEKRRAGNPGRRPLAPPPDPDDHPPAPEQALPDPPRDLNAVAVEYWVRDGAILLAEGRWRPAFTTILATYAKAAARLQAVQQRIESTGLLVQDAPSKFDIEQGRTGGKIRPNPLLATERALASQVQRLSAELGITPASYDRAAKATPARPSGLAAFERFKMQRVAPGRK